MTNEDAVAVHQRYIDEHKKAFRVAFDTLGKLWPPETDPEKSEAWFRDTAYPMCAAAFEDTLKDNPLGKVLMLAVYGYLETMAVKMRENENA